MKYVLYIFSMGIMGMALACGISRTLPSHIATAHKKGTITDTLYKQLSSCYNLYIDKCAGCHRLYSTATFTNEHWEKVLPKMYKKSKLTTIESDSIRLFITKSKELEN